MKIVDPYNGYEYDSAEHTLLEHFRRSYRNQDVIKKIKDTSRRRETASRKTHNLEIAGSNPVAATKRALIKLFRLKA